MKGIMIAIVFLAFLFASFSEDQPPAHKKLSKNEKAALVIELSRIHETYITTLLSTVRQSPIPEQDKKLFQKYATAESLMEIFIPIYVETYSEEELDSMITFYSSPAGSSIISKSQDVIEKLREISFEWQKAISEKVRNEKARSNTE